MTLLTKDNFFEQLDSNENDLKTSAEKKNRLGKFNLESGIYKARAIRAYQFESSAKAKAIGIDFEVENPYGGKEPIPQTMWAWVTNRGGEKYTSWAFNLMDATTVLYGDIFPSLELEDRVMEHNVAGRKQQVRLFADLGSGQECLVCVRLAKLPKFTNGDFQGEFVERSSVKYVLYEDTELTETETRRGLKDNLSTKDKFLGLIKAEPIDTEEYDKALRDIKPKSSPTNKFATSNSILNTNPIFGSAPSRITQTKDDEQPESEPKAKKLPW